MIAVPALVVIVGLASFALVSRRLRGSFLTGPLLMTAYGLSVGAAGLGLLVFDVSNEVVSLLAEVTLILVLFTDAADIDLRQLRRDHSLPLRLLGIGMPLTIGLGALLASLLFGFLNIWEALLLAAILAPTDAALGQAVVSNPSVPLRIRVALSVESGLNDGIALPLVLVLASFASAMSDGGGENWLLFGASQVTLGPVAGLLVGYFGTRLLMLSQRAGWMLESAEGTAGLAIAFGAFALAEVMHGNGFIAAFVAGLTFGNTLKRRCRFLLEFAEVEGRILTHTTFMMMGAVMLPGVLAAMQPQHLLYAFLSLTVVRMFPVGLACIGTGVSASTTAFLGWFGPRGLASLLFALLIIESSEIAHRDEIYAVVLLTVALSILLHGLTAGPAAQAYGRFTQKRGECAETLPVPAEPFPQAVKE